MTYRIAEINIAADKCAMIDLPIRLQDAVDAAWRMVKERNTVVRISRITRDGKLVPVRRVEYSRGRKLITKLGR